MQSIRPLKLYNTLTKSVDPLTPRIPGKVSLYCCGPTVYHFAHIGNLRTYIFEDVLVRTLRGFGYDVHHVMNITDVGHLVGDGDDGEDKMLVAMRREGKTSWQIAEFYTEAFFRDCEKLRIVRPTTVCKATDHIAEMIALTEQIIARGFGYVSNGNVYFDVRKLADYGKLARLDLDKLQAGARIDVDTNKRSPFDFALWFTKSKFENQEMQWESPWGRGYPGWHIECSAMAMKYLGASIDIHCGGVDHIANHHTNELAQSEAVVSAPWVQVWMHAEHLVMNNLKVSKSSGSFTTIADLEREGIDPIAYRFFCLGAHYRTQLNFSADGLAQATQGLQNLKKHLLALKAEGAIVAARTENPHLEGFLDAVGNDLNMPRALAAMWGAINDKGLPAHEKLGTLLAMDQYLGLGMSEWQEATVSVPAVVEELLAARKAARAARQWQESDRLRDEIKKHGFLVEDSKDGMKISPISS